MSDLQQLTDSQSLHREAMTIAVDASFEQAAGRLEAAKDLSLKAFQLEKQAAQLLEDSDLEPTRSVLLRSAASLAIDCGEFREAEKLLARGLAGNPPPEIASELRDLYEQVNMKRHLDLRGVALAEGEFQMSISGNAVGYGVVESDVFLGRVQDVEKLIGRTAERQANRPFRERGRRTVDVPVYLSAPRAASFAVTFRLGHPSQLSLPGTHSGESVVQELLECIEALDGSAGNSLEDRIRDPAYRRNFLGLIKRVAPDGDAVRAVGFTASIHGSERRVLLDRTADQIGPIVPERKTKSPNQIVEIEGVLKYADSTRKERDKIGIVDAQGTTHKVHVPEGMMDDIVRPLWEFEVRIKGKRRGKKNEVVLEDISRLSSNSTR